ncbi:putative aminotransferase [Colletotrichum spaethianum]|uniref:Aminotransferase n=1 Tax=Colletotrichum spaethianum TaxID=700344 RepID=A0AA37P5T8_9PEZI|nr:putative aminotransferase [Colletotrichum spaethianum]GKT44661.1 putative aminotransferase [Colletotrichum spaethianum]
MATASNRVVKALSKVAPANKSAVEPTKTAPTISAVLHRSLQSAPPQVVSANGKHLTFSDGRTILDTTCGAAVACIGSNNERVKRAMVKQIDKFAYCNSMFFGHEVGEQLAAELIQGTGGAMSKAYFMCSGSEAMESAMKMARQYYMELSPQQPKRVNFIARQGSYHGTTLGSLSMSGHVARRSLFLDLLLPNIAKVSACNPYRGMMEGQTIEEYVTQLADELDCKFQELGPDTVCAFVAEPVVGAIAESAYADCEMQTLGCVPAVPGYFRAMKRVCDKYGALLILDEVMSGMGRSGTLHAWQQEDVIPDIQTVAKGLGGGYAPMAGMLINHRVANALRYGTGSFSHGHTYQGHPVGCAAALEVQRIIREEELVSNVRKQGALLENLLLKHLSDHPFVGNIRGKGLFWDLINPRFRLSSSVIKRRKSHSHVWNKSLPRNWDKRWVLGDHILLAPAYTSTSDEIKYIAARTTDTVRKTFDELSAGAADLF